MTPQRWIIAGWALLAVAVALALLAAVLALDAVSGDTVPFTSTNYAAEFLRGVICAVLAGAAFFAAIACFFWSALLDSRRQLAGLLEALRPGS